MAKKGLKIFGIGVGSLIIVVGTIVGILIATGIIKTKQDPNSEQSSSSNNETPTSEGGAVMPPTFFCRNIPTITNFSQDSEKKYTLYFSQGIEPRCAEGVYWWYSVNVRANNGQAFGQLVQFKPSPNQTSLKIDLEAYSPVINSIEGEIYIYVTSKTSIRQVVSESNTFHFSFSK